MNAFDDYKQRLFGANYVEEAYDVVNPLTRSPETVGLARDLLTALISTESGGRLEALCGSPDEWFNFAVTAARIDHTTAQQRLLDAALKAHPEDVDLLCERFSFEYFHGSIAGASTIWQRIADLGEERTAPYWRYWSYRSLFLARYLHDKAGAWEFLDRARQYVIPADLLNIFRHYRRILVDGAVNPAAPAGDLTEYEYLADEVQKKYREGLELGIENGYVLATELAMLLRERSAGKPKEEADQDLDHALELLDEAERLYTKSDNHPIVSIYIEKAITLMARRRYADALQIFRSLPSHRFDESMQVMHNYAAHMTGQPETVGAPDGRGGPGYGGDQGGRLDQIENRLDQLERLLAAIAEQAGLLTRQPE
jgi:hypothetical protein